MFPKSVDFSQASFSPHWSPLAFWNFTFTRYTSSICSPSLCSLMLLHIGRPQNTGFLVSVFFHFHLSVFWLLSPACDFLWSVGSKVIGFNPPFYYEVKRMIRKAFLFFRLNSMIWSLNLDLQMQTMPETTGCLSKVWSPVEMVSPLATSGLPPLLISFWTPGGSTTISVPCPVCLHINPLVPLAFLV